ncbi:hypothetical protein SAMN04244581_01990 [Paracoccus denitrificans]|jgi:hypothetical protein|nr:hypothetical protein [Paracoccus denitrificans]SDI61856.1 hypothetical protein SAMN04244581_01990 [Paracoccus denitrificans]SFR05694.1 hypothetical protein SAMN04244569_01890 [Paracoccus denitrificans]
MPGWPGGTLVTPAERSWRRQRQRRRGRLLPGAAIPSCRPGREPAAPSSAPPPGIGCTKPARRDAAPYDGNGCRRMAARKADTEPKAIMPAGHRRPDPRQWHHDPRGNPCAWEAFSMSRHPTIMPRASAFPAILAPCAGDAPGTDRVGLCTLDACGTGTKARPVPTAPPRRGMGGAQKRGRFAMPCGFRLRHSGAVLPFTKRAEPC